MSSNTTKSVQDKTYWRSLDHLAETPEFKELVEKEFPEGASELTNPVSRRKFLSLMGASMALAGLTSCRRPVEKIIPYVVKPEEIIPGKPQYYATNMPFGTQSFGLLVESHEGRPTKIEGNKNHPGTGGASNVFMQAEMLNLYDPDRSKLILKNGRASSWRAFTAVMKNELEKHQENGGEGLAVLTESFTSPTLKRLSEEFGRRYPKASWVSYDSISDENIQAGLTAASDNSALPGYDFSKAKVILSLDSDFMQMESDDLQNARGFASGRRVESEDDTMNRLYVVEGTYSLTGGMADHRLKVQSGQIATFTAALAGELAAQGLAIGAPEVNTSFDKEWLKAVVADLLANKGQSLIVAGKRQPAHVHTLVALINEILENSGSTVNYHENQDMIGSSLESLVSLTNDMRSGKIKTLVILGGNPAYQAPSDLKFAEALRRVAFTAQVSLQVDETAKHVDWHIPAAHFLESWGDVSGSGGAGIIQPLIAPLFDGKSAIEMAGVLLGNDEMSGYEMVQETWKGILGKNNFEKKWRRVVHDGYTDISRERAVAINKSRAQASVDASDYNSTPASPEKMEVVFTASFSNLDGRYANNGWMQELPDPITKVTWDNVALMSVNTANTLNVKNEKLVKIQKDQDEIILPVWILPGIADNTVVVELGFGRHVGRVSNGVGVDVNPLRKSTAPTFAAGFTVRRASGEHSIACVQDNHGLDEEKLASDAIQDRLPVIVRESTMDDYQRDPAFAMGLAEKEELRSMWVEHDYGEGNQWGMTIDLNTCSGCSACTIACQSENNIPIIGKEEVSNGRDMSWIRLDRYFSGDVEDPEMVFQPVACQHCEMAPCEGVCPVAATTHSSEGLNEMAYNRCIGTRYCSNNCPYKVRRFNFFNYSKDMPEIIQMAMNPDVSVRFRGVMEKCTYCVQRINVAKIEAKNDDRELVDGDITTACEQACPTNAIVFGNINDPESRVSKLKAQNRDYALLGELNVQPRTSYGAKLRNPNPALVDGGHADGGHA
ncbi:MAG: TAT-variant-translocated molybdopterin oxidoreductase [Candidatus Marinimicrobia bacterium]|nr:TAT-variant-translocated molybdopterin oxidoreductase [Candidatus Neomarinimicrobiota bacterium]